MEIVISPMAAGWVEVRTTNGIYKRFQRDGEATAYVEGLRAAHNAAISAIGNAYIDDRRPIRSASVSS